MGQEAHADESETLMAFHPVAGYPSKKAACFAMIRQGKSDAEILAATGTTPGTLSVYRDNVAGKRLREPKRPRGALSLDQRMKAERILGAALPVIAKAIDCTPQHLVAFIKYYPIVFEIQQDDPADLAGAILTPLPASPIPQQPSAADEPAGDDASSEPQPAIEPIATEPEPEPMIVLRNRTTVAMDEKISTGMVTLKSADGLYLNLDGTGKTKEKAYAYRGSQSQARNMRRASVAATGMTMFRFEPPKGR